MSVMDWPPQTLTLLKQRENLTENKTKGRQRPKKSFEWPFCTYSICLICYISMYVCTYFCELYCCLPFSQHIIKKRGVTQDFCTILYVSTHAGNKNQGEIMPDGSEIALKARFVKKTKINKKWIPCGSSVNFKLHCYLLRLSMSQCINSGFLVAHISDCSCKYFSWSELSTLWSTSPRRASKVLMF